MAKHPNEEPIRVQVEASWVGKAFMIVITMAVAVVVAFSILTR